MKIVLFDIDGTLLLSLGAGKRAFNKAFKEIHNVDSAWGETKAHGRTDPDLVREIASRTLGREISHDENVALQENYIKHFEPEISQEGVIELMPGVPQVCKHLADRDRVLMGIETGNLEQTARLKLTYAGLAEFFPFGGYASDSSLREEIIRTAIIRAKETHGLKDSDVEEVVVIGDAPQDIIASRKTGARSIGVATGRATEEELNQLGADHVFSNLAELELVIETIMNKPPL